AIDLEIMYNIPMQVQIDETDNGSSRSLGDNPITFEELGIEPMILKAISELGFKTPTPIQKEAMPLLFGNKNDLIGLAQTGTGKTAAYGIPLIQYASDRSSATKVLILSPTRELCVQIAGDLKSFAQYKKDIRIVPIYGGASIEYQSKELRRGAQIIVATPGRMLDMLNRGKADVSQIETLVLDEADEMLNMGFKEELDSILENTPPAKRTLLFSATMSRDVERIALKFMHDPIEITVGKKNEGAENVSHVFYLVHAKDRYLALKRIVDYNPNIYAIIFCRTRLETQEVADQLMSDGYNADSLHGDLSQAQRDTVMQKFRLHNLQMLVATDVAARGLDVEGLTHIINYNLPDDIDHYTHRSGRTGRAGKYGVSIVIINLKEKYLIKSIEKMIGKKFKQEQVPNGKEICEKQLFNLIDRMENVEINEEIESFLPVIYKKLEWLDKEELIKRFVSREFNHFLEYYKNTYDINVHEKIDEKKGRGGAGSTGRTGRMGGMGGEDMGDMCRFFINLGRKNELTPQLLIGLVNDISRRFSIRIGKIDIMNSFSFFEADANYKDEILKSFNKKLFKGQKIIAAEAEPYGGPGKKFKEKDSKKDDSFKKRDTFKIKDSKKEDSFKKKDTFKKKDFKKDDSFKKKDAFKMKDAKKKKKEKKQKTGKKKRSE
ncbi:MAG TPA: DEAD/DEAH box helicase, partial [Candidatus Deferrimicrobium sp.]|nr:DEAD/DEAH box helicase [Candidatus Deferrimicrobium sp.]